jgi:hypothetical protein
MRRFVVLFGLIIIAVGIFGMACPEQSLAVVLHWPAGVLLLVAVAVRVVFGMVLILAAPRCRFPRIMYAVGIAALIAALVIVLLGANRIQSVVQWWFHQPPLFVQSVYVGVVLFGAFLVYASFARPRNERRSRASLKLPDAR